MAIFGRNDSTGTDTGFIACTFACSYPLTEQGTVTKVTAFVVEAGCELRGALYANDGVGGIPGTRLARGASTIIGGAGWNDLTIPDTLLSPGTYYIAFWQGGGGYTFRYLNTGLQHVYVDGGDDTIDPFGAISADFAGDLSVYATYTPSGGGAVAFPHRFCPITRHRDRRTGRSRAWQYR